MDPSQVEKGIQRSTSSDASKDYEQKTVARSASDERIEKDVAANEDLHRGLKARRLVIGSGTGLTRGGPVGLLIAYIIMGAVCFCVMMSLGEMATYLPHKKGFAGYATRFVDPAMGFATGVNYLLKYLVVTPNNVVAGAIVVQYWTDVVPVGVWIAIYIVLIVMTNMLGIKFFGEAEFWLSLFKVIVLTGLIILGLVIDLGGAPNGDRIGFRYWREQPFNYYIFDNEVGRFLGVWSCMVTALFAYSGSELVGVTFGEAKNPRITVPKTIKRTLARLVIFYVGSIFVVGLIVKANDPELLRSLKESTGASASPFVVAIRRANIRVLPDIINASILLFVMSAANSDLYIGSRTLYGLAAEGQAPRIFMRTNRYGTPFVALAFCSVICCIAFMAVSSGSRQVFTYFVALVTIFGALTWMSILFSHIRFMQALKAQGISRDTLPWKAPFQPYAAWIAFVITAIVTFFKGFDAFTPTFNHKGFITNYLGLPIYFFLLVGFKVWHKTKLIPLQEVDLVSGRREFDEDQAMWEEREAKEKQSFWKKLWDSS
ncbi:amino acid transporter [Microbotryomycetes sp. JL221]|nr:amino acid transporter [Microbotryomycetes sp. JL221]